MARFSKTKSDYDLKDSFGGISQEGTFVYETNAAKSLALWVRMTGGTAPRNLANTSVTLDYQSPPVTEQEERLQDGTKSYPVVTFVDSSGYSASAESSLLSFSSLEDGGEPTGAEDLPFSISLWFNWDGTGGYQHLFAKEGSAPTEYEYKAHVFRGEIYFYLRDEFHGGELQSVYVDPSIVPDRWYHVTFTYDGRGDSAAHKGMNIYVDGVLYEKTVLDSDASFHGMQPQYAGVLHIGEENDGNNEFDGKMSEFCAWRNHVLSSDEVKALYLATKFGSHEVISGVCSVPARLQLRERDQRGNQYPLNLRLGDRDSLASQVALPYDDTNSFSFASNFAKGSVKFSREVKKGDYVDLTGSLGAVKKRFLYVNTEDDPGVNTDNADVLIPTIKVTSSEKISLQKQASINFAKKVLETTDLRLDAQVLTNPLDRYDEEGVLRENPELTYTVVLSHKIPGTGSNSQGNVIKTGAVAPGTLADVSNPRIIANQFDISTTQEIRLGTLDPIDGGTSSIISDGHSSPTLFASASVISGISDANYLETKNYEISPFDDSRIELLNNDFFLEGTSTDVIEGFSSPLSSKTQIVIECKSSDTSGDHIYHATGSPAGTYYPDIAGTPGSGFAYWNKELRRWEMKDWRSIYARAIGGVFGRDPIGFSSSPCGFSLLPSSSFDETSEPYARFKDEHTAGDTEHNLKIARLLKGVGVPVSEFGFPMMEQYNATGSQEINMDDYINSPFLLEKIKVDIKGVFGVGTEDRFQREDLPITKNFFLLNQRTSGENPHVIKDHVTSCTNRQTPTYDWLAGSYTFSDGALGHREIIGWGKVGFLREDSRLVTGSNDNFQIVYEDYDALEIIDPTPLGLNPYVTSSLSLNIEPRLGLQNENLSVIVNVAGGNTILSNNHGGADLVGNASGRQIASSFGSSGDLTTTGSNIEYLDNSSNPEYVRPKSEYYKISPYLLFPEDRLILGWQNINPPEDDGTDADGSPVEGSTEQIVADEMVDRIQEVKVTLYGSTIRGNKEFHDTLNQNLATPEITEAIFGEHVRDQYEVEPTSVLSGSTFDALFFGDMFATSEGVRGRRASIAKGEAGSTGSLALNLGFYNENIRFRDSLAPHIEHEINDPRNFTGDDPAETKTIGGVTRNTLVLSNNRVSPSFNLLTKLGVFNSRAFTSKLARSPASNYLISPGGGPATTANFLSFNLASTGSENLRVFSGSKEDVFGVKSFGATSIGLAPKTEPTNILGEKRNKKLISSLFYSAPIISLFGSISWPVIEAGTSGVVPAIRGAKYGFISPTPLSPKGYYRRSQYGQFRDMIEQPPETYTVDVDPKSKESTLWPNNGSPVKVRFFSRNGTPDIDPLDTNTQNLSIFATSSLPYFDGLVKDRDVINFPPPDETDKTTIEEAVQAIIDGDA